MRIAPAFLVTTLLAIPLAAQSPDPASEADPAAVP